MTHYVYVHSEHSANHDLFTVGFYAPDGKWHPDSDHSDRQEAAKRVHYLNGGKEEEIQSPMERAIELFGQEKVDQVMALVDLGDADIVYTMLSDNGDEDGAAIVSMIYFEE